MTTPNGPHTPDNGKNSDGTEGAVYPAYAGGSVGEPQAEKKSVIAVWTLVIGIIALVSLLLVVPPLLLGPIGIIVSIIALLKGKKGPKELRRTWISIAGLITSIIALILSVAFSIYLYTHIGWTMTPDPEMCMTIDDPAQKQACMEDSLNASTQN
ncbi:hypothetical protein [Corynebacterium striatum]|uniref:hypothetical protein n=1 Tax=Corynebacterium striatum TaxID=43770 RepID=UPI003B59B676